MEHIALLTIPSPKKNLWTEKTTRQNQMPTLVSGLSRLGTQSVYAAPFEKTGGSKDASPMNRQKKC
jgi:hypothetical protein